MTAFAATISAKLKHTTAYHPQANGQAERLNDVVAHYLRNYVSYQQDNWSMFLPWAQLAYNSTPQTSTNISPFTANFGFNPPTNFHTSNLPLPSYRLKDISTIWTNIVTQLTLSKEAYARYQNRHRTLPPTYRTGDLVLLDTTNWPTARPNKKLGPRRQGPFEISEILDVNTVRLILPQAWRQRRIYDVFHVEKLTPYTHATIQPRRPTEPVQIIDDLPEFNVIAVHDSRVINNTIQYLVEFDDLAKTTVWEPLSSLLSTEEDGEYCITSALQDYILANPNCIHDVPQNALTHVPAPPPRV